MRDGDFTLCESKAMAMYLCNKYAKDGSKLYPKDPQTRAKIDDRLFFEATGFYTAFAATVVR
jgi:glutathione S-transferase